jgi:tartronate-semialdehyde synthase
MDFEVSLSFDNINVSEDTRKGYGVDHVAVAEGRLQGDPCEEPQWIPGSVHHGTSLEAGTSGPGRDRVHSRVTDIAMGADINAVVEFEKLAERGEDAPTAKLALLD